MNIEKFARSINNKADFNKFLELLIIDYKDGGWDNCDISSYLFGAQGFVSDIEGYYKNENIVFDENNLRWKDFANILLAARLYE